MGKPGRTVLGGAGISLIPTLASEAAATSWKRCQRQCWPMLRSMTPALASPLRSLYCPWPQRAQNGPAAPARPRFSLSLPRAQPAQWESMVECPIPKPGSLPRHRHPHTPQAPSQWENAKASLPSLACQELALLCQPQLASCVQHWQASGQSM